MKNSKMGSDMKSVPDPKTWWPSWTTLLYHLLSK